MGQQPNIELEIADLPRPSPIRGPERRWRPTRPGELTTPSDVPWGGAFGTTGPDSGYAMVLVRRRHLPVVDGEDHHNAEAAVAAIASARASHFGRAPMTEDVDVATLLLGYDHEGVPSETLDDLAAKRSSWLANLGHDSTKVQALLSSIPLEVLISSPQEIRRRLAAGEHLIQR